MAGETEQGVLGGAASGAMIGSSVAPGYGTAIGAVVGATAGYLASDSARRKNREIRKKAEYEAELARRRSIIQQMGAKQQADSLAMSSTKQTSGASKSTPSPGTVGPQVNAAGTF